MSADDDHAAVRSRATPEDIPTDAPEGPPESYEYVLVETAEGMDVFEVCARDTHRCIKLDGRFECVDCDHTEEIPDEGAQMTFGGER